ncbi:entericidin EcnA/B family protein [Celeribacter sp.]
MKKAAVLLLTLTLTSALASCGTVAGVGEDITGASRTVQGWF